MIRYQRGALQFILKFFKLTGSVFPKSFLVACPCAGLAAALAYFSDDWFGGTSVLTDNAAFGGFTFSVGFLIVFRTSQAYNRFWDGCTSTHHMRAEWFDGVASLLAFCKYSTVDDETIGIFQNTLVRLFSMLHAAALAEIEDSGSDRFDDIAAFKFPLIDVDGIDKESLRAVKDSHSKVELIFQWIQQLVVENITNGVLSIPAPILSRPFQELAQGMVAFHDAMKISYVPFPFPYAQTCDFLLVLHWLVVPVVISEWVTEPVWAFVFAFTQVFILWALNFIAIELENPFGQDANDIDGGDMQLELNDHLLLLMRPEARTTPKLTKDRIDLRHVDEARGVQDWSSRSTCFQDAWKCIVAGEGAVTVARRSMVVSSKAEYKMNERRISKGHVAVPMDDHSPRRVRSAAPGLHPALGGAPPKVSPRNGQRQVSPGRPGKALAGSASRTAVDFTAASSVTPQIAAMDGGVRFAMEGPQVRQESEGSSSSVGQRVPKVGPAHWTGQAGSYMVDHDELDPDGIQPLVGTASPRPLPRSVGAASAGVSATSIGRDQKWEVPFLELKPGGGADMTARGKPTARAKAPNGAAKGTRSVARRADRGDGEGAGREERTSSFSSPPPAMTAAQRLRSQKASA